MKSLSRHQQSDATINQKRTRNNFSHEPMSRKSNPDANQSNNNNIQSKLKMSSAEKFALDGIFRSLQVNKKPVRKEGEKEETITLSKKQLNALIGNINEVCEIVAKEPLESFKMNEKTHARPELQKESEKMKTKESRKPIEIAEEKEQKKVFSKPEKENESILGLLETKSKPMRATNENILRLLDTKSEPVNKKLNDKNQTDKVSKQKYQQSRQRRVSTVSKAVSPIIVFERKKPAEESKSKTKDIAKKGKCNTATAIAQDNSALNTQRSNDASEELVIKSNRSLLTSERTPKVEKVASYNEIEPVVGEIVTEDSPAADVAPTETVHMTLLQKKKQQWELEKRENSMLEKAITGQPKSAGKFLSKEHASRSKISPPTDNLSRKSTAEIKTPTNVIEQPAAMLDHFQLVNYNDVLVMKRKEQKQWVSELEQQREEQLLKKLLDEELRKSCIIVTPRQASTLLAEVYEESKLEPREESHIVTTKLKTSRHSENNAFKVLVQNKVRTTFPERNPVTTLNQTLFNKPRSTLPERSDQIVNEDSETFVTSQLHKLKESDVHKTAAACEVKADESAQDAYNSAQTHLVFHQAFEQPISITDRANLNHSNQGNDFGRFKALIDPSEVDRQRKERERHLEHMKLVQQQIEEKNREKERQKLKEKQEELEDEARIRRELAEVKNAGATDYNRTRPQMKPNENEGNNVMEPDPESNKLVANQNKSVHNPSQTMVAPTNHFLQRQDSDLNVDYVNHDDHNLDRYTEVKSLGEGNIGYTTTPSVSRSIDKTNKAQLETVENLRHQKKEVLNKLRKQTEPPGKLAKQSKTARGGPKYTKHVETRNNKSPPVPALQKNTLKTPANPAKTKRLSAATHNATPATVVMEDKNETSRTQPTVISSRFVDPNEVVNEKGLEIGSQSQYIPFRRSSAHMDPAIQSSRPPLASDYADGYHSNHNNLQNPNSHNQQRQKAILQQLSTLRKGLMDKQREYDRETPA